MKKIKKKKTISNIFPIFLMFMAVFIGTAFANIDNITGTIEAHAESPLQDGVFISDITEAYSAGLEGTQINTYSKRMISSKIILNPEACRLNEGDTLTVKDILAEGALKGHIELKSLKLFSTLKTVDSNYNTKIESGKLEKM